MRILRSTTIAAGAVAFVTLFGSHAVAGCGDLKSLQGPFQFGTPLTLSRPVTLAETQKASSTSTASIVGFWKFRLLSLGNTGHNPPIPDGAMIDFGYAQWHSDGTEIINSAGHAPSTQNFCLGVWGATGYLTYELNHFPISYDDITGTLENYINLKEQVTLSPSGDSFTGTFTLLIYDTKGNQVDHVAGTVVGTRLTVDSTLPTAAPGN